MTLDGQTVPMGPTFELLTSERRRRLLEHLIDAPSETQTLQELTDRMTDSSSNGRLNGDAVAIDLHHVHLPKLDAADLVEYEPATKTARYRGDESTERLLSYVRDELE